MQAADLLPDGLPPQDYAKAFLAEFGADIGSPAIFEDAVGEHLVISEELFKDGKGNWKADKRGRGPWMMLLARALKAPDEIWARLQWHENKKVKGGGKAVVRRRYVKNYRLQDGDGQPLLIVFERGADGWTGTTAFISYETNTAQKQEEADWRVGTRIYRRGGK